MGEVFLARQTGLPGFERQVILKSLLQGDGEAPPQMVTRFMDEARVAASLNHPNVVSVFEAGVWSGTFFIAMEYIPGWNISQLARDLAAGGLKLEPALAARIVHDAALGLDHAHHATSATGAPLGIVHRDVSPQNIMVRRDGITKVVDFGVAWALSRESKTRTGSVVGKVAYMAPEQLRGDQLDPRVDQYALGIVLWELLTGTRLYGARNEAEVAKAVLTERPKSPAVLALGVPEELSDIAMRMLHEAPNRRFATCGEVAEALAAVLGRDPASSTPGALARLLERLGPVPAERDAALGGDFVVKLKSEVVPISTSDVVSGAPTAPMRATPPPAQPSPRAWLIASALLTVALGGAALLWVSQPPAPAQPVAAAAAPPVAPVAAPPLEVTPSDAGGEVIAVVESPPREAPAPAPAPPPRRKGNRSPKAVAMAPAQAPAPEGLPGSAQLSVGTTPWTFAFIDGKSIGSTPVHKISVTAGRHTLSFENEDEGIKHSMPLELKPSEWKKVEIDLSRFAKKP